MNKPSLQEWLKNNPSKGINEYYQEFGIPKYESTVEHSLPVKRSKKSRNNTIVTISSISLIFIFFFPWINLTFLNITVFQASAWKLPIIYDLLGLDIRGVPDKFKLLYLLPVSSIIILIANANELHVLKVTFEVIAGMLIFRWIFFLFQVSYVATHNGYNWIEFVGVGSYCAALCMIVFFIDVILEIVY